MLLSLHIENVAIINKTDIDFNDGFNVLTGETGAGKSIIIDSINLLLGNKGSRELISTGCDYAYVSAVFSGFELSQIDLLKSLDVFPDEDGNILISRKINKDGKSVSKINGIAVTVSALKQIAPMLISIHGQHDNSKILDPSFHIDFLDEFGEIDIYLKPYYEKYSEIKAIRQKIQELTAIKNNREELENALKYKIAELENAKIVDGERDKLLLARNAVKNNTLLLKNLYNSIQIIDGDDGMTTGVSTVISELLSLKDILDGTDKIIETLENIKAEMDDVSLFVSRALSECEDVGYTEEYIEERLYLIDKIISKYGSEKSAIIELEKYKSELDKFDNNELELSEYTQKYTTLLTELENLASNISEKRRECANILEQQMLTQLKTLDMNQVDFKVSVLRNLTSRGGNKYTPSGYDMVEFLISTNAGQALKPISKIASGGEMSRIMLCLKTILNGSKTDNSTVIYDEIDAGVSGGTAQKIGLKLKDVSQNKQVFCVTHLAQIASLADYHYKVEKVTKNGKTVSTVNQLDDTSRRYEIARIMGGIEITEQLLKSADEMLNLSH